MAIEDLQEAHPDCNVIILFGPELYPDPTGDNTHDVIVRSMAMRYPEIDAVITTSSAETSLITIGGRKRVLSQGNEISW